MDEFICEGLDLVETDYEGKHFVNYWVYGKKTKDGKAADCKFFGSPYVAYKIAESRSEDLLHGHQPVQLKGRHGKVFYDKYKNPAYFVWDFNEL